MVRLSWEEYLWGVEDDECRRVQTRVMGGLEGGGSVAGAGGMMGMIGVGGDGGETSSLDEKGGRSRKDVDSVGDEEG